MGERKKRLLAPVNLQLSYFRFHKRNNFCHIHYSRDGIYLLLLLSHFSGVQLCVTP